MGPWNGKQHRGEDNVVERGRNPGQRGKAHEFPSAWRRANAKCYGLIGNDDTAIAVAIAKGLATRASQSASCVNATSTSASAEDAREEKAAIAV